MRLVDLPRYNTLTSALNADTALPTPDIAKSADQSLLRSARLVDGHFSYVAPLKTTDSVVLAVSPTALKDLGIDPEDAKTDEFRQILTDGGDLSEQSVYPWANNYGGWQFGQRAGQLGDGRAITLFETKVGSKSYEIQLKGAGKTPYGRFADGLAVLRSSIREFLVSEHLNALHIPTTRALSVIKINDRVAMRENGPEPTAVVCRFAESWLRLGNFDIHAWKGDRKAVRQLADYAISQSFGGREGLQRSFTEITKNCPESIPELVHVYVQFYLEAVRRNARSVGMWQAYGFMNGVLNTDNTSLIGLSMDYGPFAFMDTFDPQYTPNHDDQLLRYTYQNTPDIIWWNLAKLGENLGEMLGATEDELNSDEYMTTFSKNEETVRTLVGRLREVLTYAHEVYFYEYKKTRDSLFASRLGLKEYSEDLVKDLLETMETNMLDFHCTFRRLGAMRLFENDTNDWSEMAKPLIPTVKNVGAPDDVEITKDVGGWLKQYKSVLAEQGVTNDDDRQQQMNSVNPSFVLRGAVLDDVIAAAYNEDYTLLQKVIVMALDPFAETWGFDAEMENKYKEPAPREKRSMQCSCSS
ncbi:hypothetical protein CANCADRAFT_30829 [Tortispora caseinolytica NRRL Y-17796]|uniref:Selenoprotein O n=1 Tax=Tortispora caseinolytica NRRL Y-17796 TaxID=767744 RepID=A0A1E4TM18_9ASCO|nr:hypothetical protein CANCADRAFT_30829 [Tortispora caseinolytica NRRL Y-17796]